MNAKRKIAIEKLVQDARDFRLCGPSDDPDEQTAVTVGYNSLVVQLKTLAAPILPPPIAEKLNAINVEIDDIHSVYRASAEVNALLYDIEEALDRPQEQMPISNHWIVNSETLTRLEQVRSFRFDLTKLVRICQEINSSFANGNILATALLMRTVLNYVPPVFGGDTFEQVVAHAGRSLKDSFILLDDGLRKVADFHAHRKISFAELYPSAAQVEPYKPQFELLLHEVIEQASKNDRVPAAKPKSEHKPTVAATSEPINDASEYWEQRKRLADTDVLKRIYTKPRWRVWIRPIEFKKARFRNLDQCREFIRSSYVQFGSCYFPRPAEGSQSGDEWTAGETEKACDDRLSVERWILFRSSQFVYHRAFDEIPQLGERIHALHILRTVTAALEFASRMSQQEFLSTDSAITFDLQVLDGRILTWPQDIAGDKDAVDRDCWCRDAEFSLTIRLRAAEIEKRKRDLALAAALEIFSRFGWKEPPRDRLLSEQRKMFEA